MKLRRKILLSFIILLFALFMHTKVKAVSATISASSKNVTVGTKVTLTTKIQGASWQISLSGAVSETYSDSTADAEDTVKTEVTSFTPSKAGKYTINLSGNVTGSNDTSATKVSDSVTITVNDNSTNDNTTTKLSSDATLKMLGINPNDFSGFKSGTTSYSVTVPKETEKINIYAEKNQKGQTITGTGNKTLKVGENTFEVKVTAEDKKTTKTYKLIITRESISKNATLTDLGIKPNDFKGFKSGTLSYNVNVPYDTEKVEVYAGKRDGQTVTGTGEKALNVGKNTFEVKVTAEDKKTTKTYTIVVNRQEEGAAVAEEKKEEETEKNSNVKGLTKLEIAGVTLNPEFDNSVYEYSVDVTDETKKLDVKTETSSDKIKVEVIGNEDLKIGENVITLLVTNSEDNSTTTYQIIVNVKQAPVDNSLLNSTMNNAQRNLKIQRIAIYVVIAIIVALIIFFFIKRRKILNEEDYEDEIESEEVVEEKETKIEDDMEEDELPAKKHHAKGKRYK